MHNWSFAKYVGCGNDFILFDNRQNNFPVDSKLIVSLCDRQYGIGADGVLLLELSKLADCKMRIFNSDGHEAEMCGNGLRCFIKWIHALGIRREVYTIEVMNHFLQGRMINEQDVCIEMKNPSEIVWETSLSYKDQLFKVHTLNTGVPHAIIFVDNLDEIPVNEVGSYIRNHPLWQPKGTNVNFVKIEKDQSLSVRTFERGVEGETLACGTGVTAAALAAAYLFDVKSPVKSKTRSGENLIVHFDYQHGHFSKISLTGAAQHKFSGEVNLKEILQSSRFSIASNSKHSLT
ncbi:MAG: diaminopimelate epimerase [Parachlamydiaceae bacterium]|nr:diaminopimelate epimerase [Parachlamydiaceae bacterium]